MNVASRMESSGVPGRIQVSQTSFEFLKTDYSFEERGRVEIKGKGTMLTYLLKGRLFERTSSGHTKRRSAMTPVILKNLRSNTSGMIPGPSEQPTNAVSPPMASPTEIELDIMNSPPHNVNDEEAIDPQLDGIPLSEMAALQDERMDRELLEQEKKERHVTLPDTSDDSEDEKSKSPPKEKF